MSQDCCSITYSKNSKRWDLIAYCPLHQAAPAMKEALSRCIPWVGKLIADKGHLKAVHPKAAIEALNLAEEAYATAEGRG